MRRAIDNSIVKPSAVLFIICVVVSAALAFTYALTAERIEASEAAEAYRARAEVLPGAEFEPLFVMDSQELSQINEFPAVVELYSATVDKDGKKESAGHVATVLTNGYSGELYIIVGISGDGIVTGVRVSKHSETPGLGANASEPEFFEQYAGKEASVSIDVVKSGSGASGNEVAAISGATVTTDAVTRAVNAAAKLITELGEFG